ncbi:hypothetical protein [Pseudoalteromonas maricaloris]|uniref:hypothetical protein n=1 Tax=Pseudoalteromonas maricaloris TaxID=184924 RepID=UPI0039EFD210
MYKLRRKDVALSGFNKFLNENWNSSFELQKEVVFDLTSIRQISPLTASQLFSWISTLLDKQIKVDLKVSEKGPLLSFLVFSGFFSKISKDINFNCEAYEYSNFEEKNKNKNKSIIDFSSFSSIGEFKNFLRKETSDLEGELSSGAINEFRLDTKRNLKRIILKELGENTFYHSQGSPAYMMVVKKEREILTESSSLPKKLAAQFKSSSSNFFYELSISDIGIGICESLEEDYFRNFPNKSSEKINKKILEYAFEKYSSKKDRKKLDRVFPRYEEFPDLILPSGLYFVHESVRESGGIIFVQCNSTYLCYSYINGKKEVIELSEDEEKFESSKIGTSFQIYIPDKFIPLNKTTSSSSVKMLNSSKTDKIISWNYLYDSNLSGEKNTENFINSIEKQIDERQATENNNIVIDLKNFKNQTKYCVKIIIFCMYHSSEYAPVILINVPNESLLSEFYLLSNLEKQADRGLLKKLLNQVFWVNESGSGTISLKGINITNEVDEKHLFDAIEVYNEDNIRSQLQCTFNSTAKVWLPYPSEVFLRGYYSLQEVLNKRNFCFSASDIISNKNFKFNFIIQTTKSLELLSKSILLKKQIPVNNLLTVTSSSSMINVVSKVVKNRDISGILVLTDVSVTGSSVKRIVSSIPLISNIYSISLISNETVEDDYTFLRHKFEVYKDKPDEWRIDDVLDIDKESNSIKQKEPHRYEQVTTDILERWCKDKALISGHLTNGATCYISYLKTELVLQREERRLQEKVVSDIEDIISKYTTNKLKFTIIHPELNSAAGDLCGKIALKINSVDVSVETFNKFDLPTESRENNEHNIVVYIDMAVTTSSTYKAALNWAYSYGARSLRCYILVDRSYSMEFDFISGIETYKDVQVQHFPIIKFNAPAYNHNCPACLLKEKIDTILDQNKNDKMFKIANFWSEELHTIDVYSLNYIERVSCNLVTKEVAFLRHLIGNYVNYGDNRASTLEQIKELLTQISQDKALMSSLVHMLWLEGLIFGKDSSTLRQNNHYLSVSTLLISELLQSFIVDQSIELDIRSKAFWFMASFDFKTLVDIATSSPHILVKDIELYETYSLICCIFQEQHLLEKIEASLEGPFRYINSEDDWKRSSYRETYTDVKSYILSNHMVKSNTSDRRFFTSVEKLSLLFKEKNQSHPNSMILFRSWAEVFNLKDLKANLNYREEFSLYFHDVIKHIKVFIESFDLKGDEYNYLTSGEYIKDFRFIESELNSLAEQCIEGALSDINCLKILRNVVQPKRERFANHIIYLKKENKLPELLEKCSCDIKASLDKIITDVSTKYADKNIDCKPRLPNIRSIRTYTPSIIVLDSFRTVIENAFKYGLPNSSLNIKVTRSKHNTSLTFTSSSESDIEYKLGHGLQRSQSILMKFDAELNIKNDLIDAHVRIVLPNQH